jgi:hypothetical protein
MAAKSPLKGKKLSQPVAVTLTDFGQPWRRAEIRRHYSIPAAMRAYGKVWDIYQHQLLGHGTAKVWVERVVDGKPVGGALTQGR